MSTDRLAALTGLVLAAAAAAWWMGSTRLALDGAADAARSATDTLQVLWLVRSIAVAVMAIRLGALRGPLAGTAAALAVIAPAWPLELLAWEASTVPLARVILAEGVLLAASAALPLIGLGLRRSLPRVEFAMVAATVVGIALAASAWLARGSWALVPS